MKNFLPYVYKSDSEILEFYEVGPKLTCLSIIVSGDPTGGCLNVRQEHTHFFSFNGKEGGHYHTSTTPEEIEYEGYFNLASKYFRIDNANLLKWIKPNL